MAGSQWVRIDTAYLQNPKILRAGRDGALLHLAAILYLARYEIDDGVLPIEAVPLLGVEAFTTRTGPIVARLVKAGLWIPSTDAGYVIHDYDVMNGAYASRTLARERSRRWREEVNGRRTGDGP